jgi:hypothetical protein
VLKGFLWVKRGGGGKKGVSRCRLRCGDNIKGDIEEIEWRRGLD